MKPNLLRLTLVLGAPAAFAPMAVDMYTLARVCQASGGSVQLALAAFFVGLAGGQLVNGPLADRYGRKRPLYMVGHWLAPPG